MRGREKERGRDLEIVIITYTNEKLITPQLAAQAVLLEAERRGQHAASERLGAVIGNCGRQDGPNSVTVEKNQQLRGKNRL